MLKKIRLMTSWGLLWFVLSVTLILIYSFLPGILIHWLAHQAQIEDIAYEAVQLNLRSGHLEIKNLMIFEQGTQLHTPLVGISWSFKDKKVTFNADSLHATKKNLDMSITHLEGFYKDNKVHARLSELKEESFRLNTIDIILAIEEERNKLELALSIPEQEFMGIHLAPQSLMIAGDTQLLSIKPQSIALLPQGQMMLEGAYIVQDNSLKLELDVTKGHSSTFSMIPDPVEVEFEGTMSLEGVCGEPSSFEGTGKLSILKGQLLNINPIKLSNTLNLLSKLKEMPLQDDKDSQNNYFSLSPSTFDLNLKNNIVSLRGSFIHYQLKHKLKLQGSYNIEDDRWDLKVKYNYPSNPLGVSFRLKGVHKKYRLILDPVDILRVLPTMLIPNELREE